MAKGYGQACPVARALDVVGERWTLLIVRNLLQGPRRFQDLREHLAGIPPKLLSDRLRVMEEHGVIAREIYSERPLRATYTLTERGRGIALILGALTGIAAFFGIIMNANYLLAGTVSSNPVLIILGTLLMLAWRNAGWIGLDRILLPALGTPWQPGSFFRRDEEAAPTRT